MNQEIPESPDEATIASQTLELFDAIDEISSTRRRVLGRKLLPALAMCLFFLGMALTGYAETFSIAFAALCAVAVVAVGRRYRDMTREYRQLMNQVKVLGGRARDSA